jgi:hypothetical protein
LSGSAASLFAQVSMAVGEVGRIFVDDVVTHQAASVQYRQILLNETKE